MLGIKPDPGLVSPLYADDAAAVTAWSLALDSPVAMCAILVRSRA